MHISFLDRLSLSRVSIKLSLVLSSGGLLIFGAYGGYKLNTEQNGLGLAVIKAFVTAQRRTMIVVSILGVGGAFGVVLPVHNAAPPQEAP